MKINSNLLLVLLFLNIHGIYAQNAPISTIGQAVTYNTTITIPITAINFNDIGSCNMQILYDPAVLTCTAVNNSPLLPGNIAINISNPGIITFGWFTWPGAILPDDSEIFILSFTRNNYGSSAITWDNAYTGRQWSDGNSFPLNDLPFEDYYIDGSATFLSMDAPVTTAPDAKAVPGSTISIPITVNDFNNIGSFNLTLEYDDSKLTYQSFTNDSGFPGINVNGATAGTITATGLVNPGESGIFLSDNTTLFTLDFLYLGGTTDLTWFDNGLSCQYENYPDYDILTDSPTGDFYINGTVSEAIRLGIKVFLEGAFLNNEMTTSLKDLDLIPLSQPYSAPPWNYSGTESVSNIPNNVVDWVLVELRETAGDASTATTDKIIATQAGFLLKDGSIKNMNGTDNLIFPVSPSENLFIVVYHRNHIAVISANPTSTFNGNGNYDFSNGESKVWGGSAGHKQLSTGIWGLAAGDSNADGIIDDSDKNDYWNPNAGITGYLKSDFSMDSENNNIDKNNFWYLNYLFETQVPE